MGIKVLFVCLGNICRSPAAEGVFLNKLKNRGIEDKFIVDSAGTGAWHIGKPADIRMCQAAKRRGITLPSLARQILEKDFQNFDLILTMDNQNYENVHELFLKSNLPKKAKIKKMMSYSSNKIITQVPDPYYGGDDGFDQVLDLLEDACEGLLASLTTNC